MKKNIILLLTTFLLCSTAQAKGWDVAPNPYLDSPSAVTDTVNQFKELSINRFEAIISNECDRVSEFVELSINNWNMAKIGRKSEHEAKRYSEMLVQQILDTQSKLYAFPFGYVTYTALDSTIQESYFTQKKSINLSQTEFVDRMKNLCRNRLAPDKYFEILNDSQYSRGSKKNIDLNELEEKKIKSNLKKALISLNQSKPEGSKLTPKDVGKKLGFSENDLNVSYMLMAEDIKNTMKELNQPWYVYQYVLNKKYADYKYFLKNGGYNKQFAMLAMITKLLKQKSNNFKNIYTLNFKEINSLKDTLLTGDRNQAAALLKLLGYQDLD